MQQINGIFGMRQRSTDDALDLVLQPGEMGVVADGAGLRYRDHDDNYFGLPFSKAISVRSKGARGDGLNDDTVAIQAADTAAAAIGGVVFFPTGTYKITSELHPSSGTAWVGESMYGSVIKATTLSAGDTLIMLNLINKSNVAIYDLGFDGNNYPDDTSTLPKIVAGINPSLSFPTVSGIWCQLTTSTGDETVGVNIRIEHCAFQNFSDWGVRFKQPTGTDAWREIRVTDNRLYRFSYQERGISVTGLSNTGTSFARDVHVNRNTLRKNSATKYLRLGNAGFNSSTDAIEINKCQNFECIGNVVDYVAGNGIRIESCDEGSVMGNTVTDAGQNGIECYNASKRVSVIGNVVKRWGRIPNFGNLRKYGGVYYIAREAPGPYTAVPTATVQLPSDPSTSSWFEANPYNVQGVATTTIPDYAGGTAALTDGNYYDGSTAYSGDPDASPPTGFAVPNDQGILAFRGYAGIAVTQLSEQITIMGNTLIGSTAQTGGKYDYASDYGIMTVHSSNNPQNYNSPVILGPNFISGCIKREVYQPAYCDPVNRQGVIDGVKYFPGQIGLKSSSATNTDEPLELFPSLSENILYSETIPSLVFGTGHYAKVEGTSRPSIGTNAFGLFLFVRFTGSISTSVKYLFDAGVGGASTIGFRLLVKRSEINWSCSDGSSNFEVKYTTVTDWGAGDNKVLLLYACRDTDGTLRLNVNGVEKSAAGPSPIANLDTGNAIGIGAQSNGASEDIPFELFKAVLWQGTFTAQEIAERIGQKKLIRYGDTVLMDLDMKTQGLRIKDKVDTSRIITMISGVSCSDPTPESTQRLWSKTATTAVANTTTETSLLDTGSGSKVLGPRVLTVGQVIEVDISGYLSTTGTPSLQWKYKWGSTAILDTTAVTMGSGVTNKRFRFQGRIVVRSLGSSGTVFAEGELEVDGLTKVYITNTATTTVNTTTSITQDVTATWSAASASNTVSAAIGQILRHG